MTWRPAKSLVTLLNQINAAYPNRNKASDGLIGDPSHQAEGTGSDHNPNKHGVVCALDITHDPAHGVDIDKLSDELAASRDPRIKYLIANGLILVPADYGWTWQPYTGDNPHTSHLHISVYGNYDDTTPWNISKEDIMQPTEAQVVDAFEQFGEKKPESKKQIDYYTGQDIRVLYKDVLYGLVIPKAKEVEAAFTKYLPDAGSDPRRVPYYTNRSGKVLYRDIAGVLKERAEKVLKESKFEPITETVYREKK